MDVIKAGSVVRLLYWKDQKVYNFLVNDIYLEPYINGFKTIIKAAYYSDKSGCFVLETFFANDFFQAMSKAKEQDTRES